MVVDQTAHELNIVLIIWGALTTLTTLLGVIVGYFMKGWKKRVDDEIDALKKHANVMISDEAKCKLNIATNFLRIQDFVAMKQEMKETFAQVFTKFDSLSKEMHDQHTQVMYELGVKNGIKRTNKPT